ncbi:hypothetical protein [Citrobacter rodentium]|nr:hypothetical protein [Citrobacter rodentium]UHO32887.1 hypothetical protein K7R23_09815 [Citrobacter rodentium NBRC 105723 = DSM 16636]
MRQRMFLDGERILPGVALIISIARGIVVVVAPLSIRQGEKSASPLI